jgi:serine/threonine-protein kinase
VHDAVGPYVVLETLSRGRTTSVHRGAQVGPSGFIRHVAIKRLEPPFCRDTEHVVRFFEEARLGACVRHPNVVSTTDLVARSGDVLAVMDLVPGASLASRLAAIGPASEPVDPAIAVGIALDVLEGLHAIHEANDAWGTPLEIVHRNVTPTDILIGADGIARVGDFGVADAAGRASVPTEEIDGPLRLRAPELLSHGPVDRRADVYAVGAILWEMLTRRLLFWGSDAEIERRVRGSVIERPSAVRPGVPRELDDVVVACLAKDPEARPKSALEAARALMKVHGRASARRIATWTASIGKRDANAA